MSFGGLGDLTPDFIEDKVDGAKKLLGKERRARHLVTSARASASARRREDAKQHLLDAEQLAPEEVRRPAVIGLVRELLMLVPNPDTSLSNLAQRCGLPA